jgi:hypothetical protein
MRDRAELIESIRSEIVGPAKLDSPFQLIFTERVCVDPVANRRGGLVWQPSLGEESQEILYFDRESPHRKYGAGLLHPPQREALEEAADLALRAGDTIGADVDTESVLPTAQDTASDASAGDGDDFEISDRDVRRPSSMSVSACIRIPAGGALLVRLPTSKRFAWQSNDAQPLQLNGRYERCTRRWRDDSGEEQEGPAWRRVSAFGQRTAEVCIRAEKFQHGRLIREDVSMPTASPLRLRVEVFTRLLQNGVDWLVTVVLRNTSFSDKSIEEREQVLFQSYFELALDGGQFRRYPESHRDFRSLDEDEQSLALLYRDAATWAIGHGCAAGWDSSQGSVPSTVFADVMPAVELPSMTPDVETEDGPVRLSMRVLSKLQDDGSGVAWDSLQRVRDAYASWIVRCQASIEAIPEAMKPVALRHMTLCEECLARIDEGLGLLLTSAVDREAFRLANFAMLLQQIATKHLKRRALHWDPRQQRVVPHGQSVSPLTVWSQEGEDPTRIGGWRAFQIAFLLMSIPGLADPESPQRDIVDLIWFPTGGGKTEAYLASMAYYMFRERLVMREGVSKPYGRDGTNVLMRYTLRMLTTQQFQRAASLICAMEKIRRSPKIAGSAQIPGRRFSLGLWVGGQGSPNKISEARSAVKEYHAGKVAGNPLVLTECPWCRCAIGKVNGGGGKRSSVLAGIMDDQVEGPRLLCPDTQCDFGPEQPQLWLPVEVIDERIYRNPPSLVIATADKLAITAYRPSARALFGLEKQGGEQVVRVAHPPGLIIQDELHLISGPLGTMYALYEGIIERLCSDTVEGRNVRPKIIASTATIRGAGEQVKSLYERSATRLFPSPGLSMGDSFFGRYATDKAGQLLSGRLYLGLHASDYGSVLTTQVRAFSTALYAASALPADRRDAWWTLLAFYNSIRELGGARTLFDSDIKSRLKFLFNREGVSAGDRRHLREVDELTSRLSQAEIVGMMDRLSVGYGESAAMDACLASNIIEVGVDIDRLSLMGIVGQPKTTSTYIQVSGRVGRRWQDRPGLVLMIYNPSKSRDRSHFEQFHSYHRRLYERVEPASTTPFAISALRRGLAGAMLVWARSVVETRDPILGPHHPALADALATLTKRCELIQGDKEGQRAVAEMKRIYDEIIAKWKFHPQEWEHFPPSPQGEYLMLWPGQFATDLQRRRGTVIPSSMRQVDASAELAITSGYASGMN